MTIVLTIHHFPPRYRGGAENYVFTLARNLTRRGHRVEVVCIEDAAHGTPGDVQCERDVYLGLSIHRLRCNVNESIYVRYENVEIGTWFESLLQRVKPDLVHVHSCYLLSVTTIEVAQALSLPVVLTLHDFWFLCPRITLLKPNGDLCRVPEEAAECSWCIATESRRFRWLDTASWGVAGKCAQKAIQLPILQRSLGIHPAPGEIAARRDKLMRVLQGVDHVLAPSNFLRTLFINQGLSPDRIKYCRLGLDTKHWNATTRSRTTTYRPLCVAYIGQIAPHKGVHVLLKAFHRLRFDSRKAVLRVYGQGGDFPSYMQQLKDLQSSNSHRAEIHFMGGFENGRVPEVLNEVDLIVVPSLWYENSPLSILEALSSGTPVVTSDVGGMSELVQHESNGLLFQTGSSVDLSTQIQRLLDEPNLCAELSARARQVRTSDDEMAQIMEIYSSAVRA